MAIFTVKSPTLTVTAVSMDAMYDAVRLMAAGADTGEGGIHVHGTYAIGYCATKSGCSAWVQEQHHVGCGGHEVARVHAGSTYAK